MLTPAEVLFQVVRTLEELNIAYVVVGSFASAARVRDLLERLLAEAANG